MPTPTEPDYIEGDARQAFASRVHDVLHSAPELKQAPGTALAIAKAPGDARENAQSIAAVAHSRNLEHAVKVIHEGVGSDSTALQRANRLAAAEDAFKRGGSVAPVEAAQQGLQSARGNRTIENQAGPAVGQIVHDINALPNTISADLSGPQSGTGGLAPGVTSPQFSGGLHTQAAGITGAINPVQQANQLMQAPSHTYRYIYDVKARHGTGAAVLAALPLIGGAVAGVALTHGEGGAAGEDVVANALGVAGTAGPTDAAAVGDSTVAGDLGVMPKSAGAGMRAAQVTRNVLNPIVTPLGAAAKGVSTALSSPALAGGEGAVTASGHVLFPDSWQRTSDATTWKLPNGTIGPTFGQFVAGEVGLQKGSGWYNATSGALDGAMAMAVPDMLGAGGRVVGKAKSGEGLGGYLGSHWASGTAPVTAEGVEAAVTQSRTFRAALHDMVGKKASEIAIAYPMWEQVAPDLAKHNSTFEDVVDRFKSYARTQELTTTATLPTRSWYTRVKQAGAQRTTLLSPATTIYDDDLQKFVGRQLPTNSTQLAHVVNGSLRAAGENVEDANRVTETLLANRDPVFNRDTVRNAYKDLVARRVEALMPADASEHLLASIKSSANTQMDELMGGTGAGQWGQFGSGVSGGDLSTVETDTMEEEAKSLAAAIWFNQHDHVTAIDPTQINELVHSLAASEKWLSKNGLYAKGLHFEQLIDHTVNEKIFQPLALATMGWASRVSVAELAQNMFRLGPMNMTAAFVADRAAKQGYKISTQEMPHFLAAVRGVLQGVGESTVKAMGKERMVDAATAYIAINGGHMVHPALDSQHHAMLQATDMPTSVSADVIAARRRLGRGPTYVRHMNEGDQYTIFAPHNTGYFRSWSEYAGRIAHDEFGSVVANAYADAYAKYHNDAAATLEAESKATDFLKAQSPEKLHMYTRSYARSKDGKQLGRTTLEDWAHTAVEALRGTVYGQDGTTLHRDLLEDIIDKNVPDVKGMIGRYGSADPTELPSRIPGREIHIPGKLDVLPRLTNRLHASVLGPIVNTLSREPTSLVDFANERKILEPKVKLGEMSQDQADVLANKRAAFKSIRFVHNPQDRLKIENMLHIYAPFFFAQNQSFRRVGRLLASNPGAGEQYLKSMFLVNNMAATVEQKNGLPLVVVPGSALVGNAATGSLGAILQHLGMPNVGAVPVGLTATVSPSTTIDPFSNADTGGEAGIGGALSSAFVPHPGMAASIPLKAIQDFFSQRAPKVSGVASNLLGPVASSQPFWTQAVPNSLLQHVAEGITGQATEGDLGGSYLTALLHVLPYAVEHNKGTEPSVTQLQGGGYPNSSAAKAQLIKEVNNTTAITWLLRTLVSFASPVSVSLSRADLKASDMFQNYITSHNGDVTAAADAMAHDHPDLVPSMVFASKSASGYAYPETDKAAAWIKENQAFVTKYPAAARWFMPNTDTTGKFSDKAYNMQLAMGLRVKETPAEMYDQFWVAAGMAHYYDEVQPLAKQAIAQGSNPYDVYTKVDADLTKYGQQYNPIWLDYWNAQGSKSKRGEVVQQIGQAINDPATPKSPYTSHLSYLIDQYNELQAAQSQGLGTSKSRKAIWEATMNQTMQRWPDTSQVIKTVFMGMG